MTVNQIQLWREPSLRGVEVCRSHLLTHNFPKHFHTAYGIGLCINGHGQIFTGGKKSVTSHHDLLFLHPGEVHHGCPVSGNYWDYGMLYLEPELVAHVLGVPGTISLGRETVYHFDELVPSFVAFFRTLTEPTAVMEKSEALYSFLSALAATARTPILDQANQRESRLAAARDLIFDCWDQELSIEELADQVALHPRYLISSFKQRYGMPPHQYQVQVRLNKARDLLAGGQKIVDVALSCGFYDQSHLNRVFKRCMGVTPGAYARLRRP